MNLNDSAEYMVEGHIKIWCPNTGIILLNKRNAIHNENMSLIIAASLFNNNYINELHLGNGGTTIDSVGNIAYKITNTTGLNADLYNNLYYKNIVSNSDQFNKIETTHTNDTNYSDIIITATLEVNEPDVNSNLLNSNNEFIFDEIGLKSYSDTPGSGKLLTHVIFHPITKTLTNQVQIVYTLRFRIGT